MSISYNFAGKVALITGSSSGIGASIAILMSRSGARVVVSGLDGAEVRSVADECARVSPSGLSALEVVVDFRRESDVRKVIDTTIEAYGQLDVLVNCAAYMVMANIMDSDYIEKQKAMFDVNLNAVILLTQLSVKHLAKTNGNIISISSVGAIKPVINYLHAMYHVKD